MASKLESKDIVMEDPKSAGDSENKIVELSKHKLTVIYFKGEQVMEDDLSQVDPSEYEVKEYSESLEFAAGLIVHDLSDAGADFETLIRVKVDGKAPELGEDASTSNPWPKFWTDLVPGHKDAGDPEDPQAYDSLTPEQRAKVVVHINAEAQSYFAVCSNFDFLRGLYAYSAMAAQEGVPAKETFDWHVKWVKVNGVNLENVFEFIKARV